MFFEQIAHSLEESGVPYCVVGGLAVAIHGVLRFTYDVDIVVVPSAENLRRIDSTLRELGLEPNAPMALTDLAEEAVRERMAMEQNLRAVAYVDPREAFREVDVVVSPGADPAAMVSNASPVALGNCTLRVAAIDDLIAMKRLAGRPQDAADLAHLERLKARR